MMMCTDSQYNLIRIVITIMRLSLDVLERKKAVDRHGLDVQL